MYYHVKIDYYDSKLKVNQTVYEYDITSEAELKDDVIVPYISEKEFVFKGTRLNTKNNDLRQLRIFRSDRPIKECVDIANSKVHRNVIMVYHKNDILPFDGLVEECTKMINEVQKQIGNAVDRPQIRRADLCSNNEVFIVHGHDDAVRLRVEDFLNKIGLKPIVLFREPDEGNTIIEKFEKHSNVGFAIVLYTYCDDGKSKTVNNYQKRARQNVVFEHGYMIAKLGRNRVCALRSGDIEIPSDYQGVLFKSMGSDDGWHLDLAKELKAAGYNIDLNKLI